MNHCNNYTLLNDESFEIMNGDRDSCPWCLGLPVGGFGAVNVPAALPRGYSSRCGGTPETPFVEPDDDDVPLSYITTDPRENRLRTTADANKGRLPGWSSGLCGGRRRKTVRVRD